MIDLLTNLLPLIGGGIFGAVLKLWANAQQAKADYNKQMFHAIKGDRQERTEIRNNPSKGFAWTRRFIVLAVTSVIIGAFWIEGGVTVPIEVTEGATYLFGLIDTRTTETIYEVLEDGRVVLPVMMPSFQAIIGFYLGQSTVGNIR